MTYNEKTNELNVPDITMYEMVKRLAEDHPSATAYEYLGTTGTYSGLFEKTDEFAKSFAACQTPPRRFSQSMPSTKWARRQM